MLQVQLWKEVSKKEMDKMHFYLEAMMMRLTAPEYGAG